MVARAVPEVWSFVTPQQALDIRLDAVDPARMIEPNVASYANRAQQYRDQLRRID